MHAHVHWQAHPSDVVVSLCDRLWVGVPVTSKADVTVRIQARPDSHRSAGAEL